MSAAISKASPPAALISERVWSASEIGPAVYRDQGAFRRKPYRGRLANARRCTGDERDFSRKAAFHLDLPDLLLKIWRSDSRGSPWRPASATAGRPP